MKIYIESLYNYRGQWVDLKTIDEDELIELENKYSLDGMHDIIIADWDDAYFNISMYSNPITVWEKVQFIERENIELGKISLLESDGYNIMNMDDLDIKSNLENIYSIEATDDKDFAYEYYNQIYDYDLDNVIPSVFMNAINWEKVYDELEIYMTILDVDGTYYYKYK